MAMTATNRTFFLMNWDDNTTTTIPSSCVLVPRKDYNFYEIGEQVTARCPGYPGKHTGTIADISCK